MGALLLSLSLQALAQTPEPPPQERPVSLFDTSEAQYMAAGPMVATFGGAAASCAAGLALGAGAASLVPRLVPSDDGAGAAAVFTFLGPPSCVFGAAGVGRLLNGRAFVDHLEGSVVGFAFGAGTMGVSAAVYGLVWWQDSGVGAPFPFGDRRRWSFGSTALVWGPALAVFGGWTTRAANRAPQARALVLPVADAQGPGVSLHVRW